MKSICSSSFDKCSTIGASKGAGGQPAALHCLPSLREGSLRCSGSWPRRRTHYAHCVSSVQTTAASQITKRAARADPGPALLVATEIAPAGYRLPRFPPLSSSPEKTSPPRNLGASAKARAGSRRRASAQPRSAGLVARARSALRLLTRRGCLNAANAVRAVSSAAGPRDRAPQGTLAQRGQAVKRRRLPARAFARANRRARTRVDIHRMTATGREPMFDALRMTRSEKDS